MPGRDRVLGATVVLVLLGLLAATAVWRVNRDDISQLTAGGPTTTEEGGTQAPGTTADPLGWPAEIAPLARFVERERGKPFDHAVPIEFLDQLDYEDRIAEETQDLTAEDLADLELWEGQLRSLGLLGPEVDLLEAQNEMYGQGTLAFYDSEADTITVLGTEMDVARRVTLVHELTHAWQDQHADIGRLDDDDVDDTLAYTLTALAEGDAMMVEHAYIDGLTSSELDDYEDQSRSQAGSSDLSGVPDVMVASFSSAYALGGPFVTVLAEDGGADEVDAALVDPPTSEAGLVNPLRYLDGDEPAAVPEPSVPAGAERLDGGTFGAVSWLLTLAERVDPRTALAVVDTWAGDQSVTYRQDARICTATAYRGVTASDTVAAADAMRAWAAASTGLGATVEDAGGDVVLRSCEPPAGEAGPPVAARSQTAVAYPALRLEIMGEALVGGWTIDEAFCIGDHVAEAITYDDMASGAAYDSRTMQRLGRDAIDACE